MNPNEIPSWLEQHDGADGPPQTDANGVTTHRAKDGSYLTVYAGQVRMISSPPMQPQTDEQAPAQPAQRTGGGMGQTELEAKIAELQKQYPGLKFMGQSIKDKDVKTIKDGLPVTVTTRVPVVEWRDPSTGYTLTAEVGEGGGSYTVVEDRIIDANKGDKQPSGTKEGDTRGPQNGPKREVFRNGQWVTEDNPLYKPENPTAPKEEVNPSDPTRIRRWNPKANNGQGGWEDAGPNAAGVAAAAPKPEKAPDGTYGYWDTKQTPPKWVPIQGGPQAVRTPVEINGQWGVWESGSDGTPVWKPVNAPQATPAPAEAGNFRPDPNKPALGLVEFTQQLAALRADGKLTDKQYEDAIRNAHAAATSEASRLDTITRAQQTQQANEINQRATDMQASSNRLTAANSATQNALDTSLKMAGNFTNASYASAGGPILPAVMALQDARAMAWGGMNSPAPVGTQGYPALQQVGQMGLSSPAPTTNVAVSSTNGIPPQGAPPTALAPGMTAPLLPPRPVTAPVVAAPQQVAPATPGSQQARDDWRTQPNAPTPIPAQARDGYAQEGSATPFSPVPSQVVPNMIQQQEGPVGGQVLPGPWNQPSQMPVPVVYPDNAGAVSQQLPAILPAVNTLGIAAEVAARGGYTPEVMQQALRELGWS